MISFSQVALHNKRNALNKRINNDYWGFLKGRSTIFYSKLLGIPLTITNHIIDEDIDSGHILNIL